MEYSTQVSTEQKQAESLMAIELLPVVEQAAIESARLMGCGDRHAADDAATEAMRQAMDKCDIDGTIVIGEGERDEAPMLYIGERVGRPGSANKVDIAVDPLEGTNLCATGTANAIAVMAVSEPGGLLHAPDIYMEKLVVPQSAKGLVDLDAPIADTCKIVAKCLNRSVDQLVVTVLERERHQQIIADLRAAGARIKLIGDGDLSAGITAVVKDTNVHMVVGTGGAPEGVITAAAVKCLGGEILGRLVPKDDAERARCEQMGADWNKVMRTDDMAPGEHIVFIASGVTKGDLLDGVRFMSAGVRVDSMMVNYASKTVRFVDSVHLTRHEGFPIRRV